MEVCVVNKRGRFHVVTGIRADEIDDVRLRVDKCFMIELVLKDGSAYLCDTEVVR